MEQPAIFGEWYFAIPNFALAALMYTLFARFLLSLVFAPNSDKVAWKVFKQITDPVLRIVRMLTPGLVPDTVIPLLAFAWVFAIRIALFIATAALAVQF